MKIIDEEYIFIVPARFSVLPFENVSTLNGTTPNVRDIRVMKGSGLVVTITNFVDGSDGHSLRILGDGSTTIANNANIKTNTGVNKLLGLNKIYTFTLISNVWYENA